VLSEIDAKMIEGSKHGAMAALTEFWKAKRAVMADRDAALIKQALIDLNPKRK
jgi:hypothetical protein